MFLSLYTVRIVLNILGSDDFGLYSLIAGVVSLLAFITNALVQTTQRFVSYNQGKGDVERVKEIFCTSTFIHILLGVSVGVFLELMSPLLFDGFLNIPIDRLNSAKIVYQVVEIMLVITFITSPFRALLISHENIVYISIIDVLDGILKFILALLLSISSIDLLVFYALSMLLVQVFNFVAFSIYSFRKYQECIIPRLSYINKSCMKEIISFAGWNVYSTGCIVGRQQGVAIIINRLLGTVANAAYGIGFQLSGYTNFLSASLVNAIRPQIMRSEGSGNRERALWLSNIASKFSFFLLSAVCVPCMFEIDTILNVWLGNVPEYASTFSIMVLLTVVVDSVTGGLGHINQAVGNIKMYSVFMNTPKLLSIPISWLLLKYGFSVGIMAMSYVVIELLCTWMRVPFVSRTAGLNIRLFLSQVVAMEVVPIIVCIFTCYLCVNYMHFTWRFLATIGLSTITYVISIYYFGLTNNERLIISGIVNSIINRFKK